MRLNKSPTKGNADEPGTSAEALLATDERTVRLADLKLAVEKGTYRISTECIADKLLEHLRTKTPKG